MKAILWCQLLLGLVGTYVAFWDIHTAALGIEWSREVRREFDRIRQTQEYREPASIRGYSQERFVDNLESDAQRHKRTAFLAFSSSLGASLFAAVLLWRIPPRS